MHTQFPVLLARSLIGVIVIGRSILFDIYGYSLEIPQRYRALFEPKGRQWAFVLVSLFKISPLKKYARHLESVHKEEESPTVYHRLPQPNIMVISLIQPTTSHFVLVCKGSDRLVPWSRDATLHIT